MTVVRISNFRSSYTAKMFMKQIIPGEQIVRITKHSYYRVPLHRTKQQKSFAKECQLSLHVKQRQRPINQSDQWNFLDVRQSQWYRTSPRALIDS